MIRPVQILVIRSAFGMSVVMVLVFLALASQFSIAASEGLPPAELTQIAKISDNGAEQTEITTAQQDTQPNASQSTQGQEFTLECQVSDSFPEEVSQWCDLITQYANEHGLAPDLVAAVVWLESGGNATAYSRSGAVGLMQVMPRDGLAASFQCVNGPCFASRPTIEELEDPAYNIEYGTRMLAGLYGRYESWREALKSYGPMGVGYSYADKVLAIFERYGNN